MTEETKKQAIEFAKEFAPYAKPYIEAGMTDMDEIMKCAIQDRNDFMLEIWEGRTERAKAFRNALCEDVYYTIRVEEGLPLEI